MQDAVNHRVNKIFIQTPREMRTLEQSDCLAIKKIAPKVHVKPYQRKRPNGRVIHEDAQDHFQQAEDSGKGKCPPSASSSDELQGGAIEIELISVSMSMQEVIANLDPQY
eukprot:3021697-Amphidinium_carterae.1